jgi:hypothetical protein
LMTVPELSMSIASSDIRCLEDDAPGSSSSSELLFLLPNISAGNY